MRRTISLMGEVLYIEERKSSLDNYGLDNSNVLDYGWTKMDKQTNILTVKHWEQSDGNELKSK